MISITRVMPHFRLTVLCLQYYRTWFHAKAALVVGVDDVCYTVPFYNPRINCYEV